MRKFGVLRKYMFPLVESQFRGGASSFFYMKHHRHWQEVMDSDSLELFDSA